MLVACYDFSSRYYPIISASLPFSAGALIYHYKNQLRLPKYSFIITGILYVGNIVFAKQLWENVFYQGFYVSYILSTCLLISLTNMYGLHIPKCVVKMDGFFGNLSYPLFLSHWQIAVVVCWLIEPATNNWRFFLYTLVFANVFSLIIHYLFERRINKIRNRIKKEVRIGPKNIALVP